MAKVECPGCGKDRHDFLLGEHPLHYKPVCDWCRIDADRAAAPSIPVHERDGIDLGAVRDERNMRLAATDWIELPSARARRGPAFAAAMDAYRSRLFEVVKHAAAGITPAWPDLPAD